MEIEEQLTGAKSDTEPQLQALRNEREALDAKMREVKTEKMDLEASPWHTDSSDVRSMLTGDARLILIAAKVMQNGSSAISPVTRRGFRTNS